MGYYNFPHTRNYDSDLAFLICRYKELIAKVDGIQSDILEQAKAYTDDQIDLATAEINSLIEQLNSEYNAFITNVNNQLNTFDTELDRIETKLEQEIIGVNARTDFIISQNNEYLREYINSQLIDVKVVNYFTGKTVTIQEMFDYLAQFHLTNAITYEVLAARRNSYTDLQELNITYTELAINGASLIPAK